ncbi:hypothetical protein NIES4071_23270 [Calothrix sp. NIES-4071]|nr:hypothetical protein NIES4071_23270 [Calothrix sp. NIES-4071]BAZ56652.1 hypothetical protein NIES4105_23220 [Calothrix sp. NIES-4105]
MKEVLKLIEAKKQEFSQLPLFQYMQDTSIDPRQRLAWAPCAAPFIMSFGDLNKYIFRESSCDPIQILINKHTYEDDHHWLWFIRDIRNLELDKSLKFSDSLEFLWGEEAEKPRWVTYQLCRFALQATPIQKLIVVEVTEATGNVMFSVAAKLGKEIKSIIQKDCLYFDDFHLAVETGHTTGSTEIDQILAKIQLSEQEQLEAFELVEKVFNLFTQMTNCFLTYAQKHQVKQLVKLG